MSAYLVPRIEPWPAGGWAVWVDDGETPVSRHDTEEEARFCAEAYRHAVSSGHELALTPEPAAPRRRQDAVTSRP